MFCPVCKAEYRLGFTHCSDCDVDLVEYLPDDSSAQESAGDPDAPEVLWAGGSAAIRGKIERALEAAQIQFTSDTIESKFMPAFRENIFRVQVRRGDLAAALSALQNVEGESQIAREAPGDVLDSNSSFLETLGINRNRMGRALEQSAPPPESISDEEPEEEMADIEDTEEEGSPKAPVPDDVVEDFRPEDATSEVWSGEDAQMAGNFEMCLREVGIGCVLEESGGKTHVRVMAESEARALEIIREVIEATPPE